MKKLPEYLPEYKIEKSNYKPFSVKCEELLGLSIIPRVGEKSIWGLYDFQTRKCEEYSKTAVLGKAEVHGIEGVEIESLQYNIKNNSNFEGSNPIKRSFVAQLTDTHCRYLAESHFEGGVRKTFTFLDSDTFMNNWGFGDDNCGNPINILPKNEILREDNIITKATETEVIDIVGRYTVTINGKTYDTVCVMDIGHLNNQIAIEQFLDKKGRTILWRRFNRNDWAFERYGKLWSDKLPKNERLIINGETYVHWYDCITDYIF